MAPEHWTRRPLGSIVDVVRDAVAQSRLNEAREVSLYSIPSFDASKSPERIAGSSIKSSKYLVPPDCILLSKLNPRIPRVWRVRRSEEILGVSSTEFWPIVTRDHAIDLDFLAYVLSSDTFREHPLIKPAATTKSHQRIELSALRRFEVEVPPLESQKKIAAVLSSLDEAHAATQVVIEQLQVVKEAMLAELLTRGIPGCARRMKNTALGQVPEDWTIAEGQSIFSLAGGGYGPRQINFSADGEVLFMKVDDLNRKVGQRFLADASLRFRERDNRGIRISPPGGIVFAKRGAAIFKNRVRILGAPAAVDPNLMVLSLRPGTDIEFFAYALEFIRLANLADNSGIPQINNKHLYPYRFVLPSLAEQKRIRDSLGSVVDRIAAERDVLAGLERLKSALLPALLTGEIRVPLDSPPA